MSVIQVSTSSAVGEHRAQQEDEEIRSARGVMVTRIAHRYEHQRESGKVRCISDRLLQWDSFAELLAMLSEGHAAKLVPGKTGTKGG